MPTMLRKSILILAAVALSSTAFASDVRLGPEVPLIPFSYPYSRSQRLLHSASTAGHFMAVWTDDDGKGIDGVVDGRLITIVTSEPDSYVRPLAVAGGNRSFLVVWSGRQQKLMATRVAFDGSVIDSPPIILRDEAEVQSIFDMRAMFNGTSYGLVWAGVTLRSATVGESDGSVSVNDVPPPPIWGAPRSVQILSGGSDVIVPYSLERFIAADPIVKLAAAIGMVVLDPATLSTRDTIFPVFDRVGLGAIPIAAARAGDTITIAWPTVVDEQNAIAIAQVTTSGQLLAGPRLLREKSPGESVYIANIQMIRDGNQYVLCWIEGSSTGDPNLAYRIAGMRLDQNANPLDETPFEVAELSANPYPTILEVVDMPAAIVVVYSTMNSDGRIVAFTRTLNHPLVPPRRRSARP